MKKYLLLLCTFLLLSNNLVFGQHYGNWTGFEYTDLDNGVYELQKDYTISLPEFFLDQSKMPSPKIVISGRDNYRGNADTYRQIALYSLPRMDGDFIRLESGGILTIKKGYRWDGTSKPGVDMGHEHFRSSLVHDVLYDLMRMGYLEPDKNHLGTCEDYHYEWGTGDYNRAMADILHYIIAREDGETSKTALFDFRTLRRYAACRSSNTKYLYWWKEHIHELTAYTSDGNVELKWEIPNYSKMVIPGINVKGCRILRDNREIAFLDLFSIDYSGFWPIITLNNSYIDSTVTNGKAYSYIIEAVYEMNGVILDNQMYNPDDLTNEDNAFPIKGPGNALKLDGNNNYLEANTTSNDLCFNTFYKTCKFTMEAWINPESKAGKSAIIAFNTISGKNYNLLMYDGDIQRFCYYDDNNRYVPSKNIFPVNNWYHVAVTIDQFNNGVLYVNGLEQANFNTSIRPKHGARLSIGQEWDNNEASNFFKGCIDEIRIWNDVLSIDKLKENMYYPLRGDEDSLVALWHFDEPAETNLFKKTHDATSNANDGMLMGYADSDLKFVPSGAMVPDTIIPDTAIVTSKGLVTGDGWINSPQGALVQKPNITGKANFSFVCNYMDGATRKGKTNFHFNQAEFKFKSTSYDRLIIIGDKAVYTGLGKIEGRRIYGFMISVIDGDLNGNDEEDRFRIKIWDKKDSTVIYDNEIGTDEEADPTTVIGAGSIVIHIQETETDSISDDRTDLVLEERTISILDNDIKGFENENISPKIQVYPNPAENYLTVRIKGNEDKQSYLKIYDSFGKLIHSYLVKDNIDEEIDVSSYKTGLYFVTTIIDGEIIKQKVFIE